VKYKCDGTHSQFIRSVYNRFFSSVTGRAKQSLKKMGLRSGMHSRAGKIMIKGRWEETRGNQGNASFHNFASDQSCTLHYLCTANCEKVKISQCTGT
jgi:hypothetical protein